MTCKGRGGHNISCVVKEKVSMCCVSKRARWKKRLLLHSCCWYRGLAFLSHTKPLNNNTGQMISTKKRTWTETSWCESSGRNNKAGKTGSSYLEVQGAPPQKMTDDGGRRQKQHEILLTCLMVVLMTHPELPLKSLYTTFGSVVPKVVPTPIE